MLEERKVADIFKRVYKTIRSLERRGIKKEMLQKIKREGKEE